MILSTFELLYQAIFLVVIFALILVCRLMHDYVFKIKKKKEEDYQRDKETIYIFVNWMLVVLFVFFTINIIVTFAKKFNFTLVSVLDYNEAEMMAATALPTIIVAYFQYKVQLQMSKRERKENYRAKKWHYQELRAERLRSIKHLTTMTAFAVNGNLKQSTGVFETGIPLQKQTVYYIEINNDSNKDVEFFPGCFEIKSSEVYITPPNGNAVCPNEKISFRSDKLKLEISSANEETINMLADFFDMPSVINNKWEDSEDTRLKMEIRVKAFDKSIPVKGKNNDKSSASHKDGKICNNKAYLDIGYSMILEISIKSGYERCGRFKLGIDDFSVCLTNYGAVNKK